MVDPALGIGRQLHHSSSQAFFGVGEPAALGDTPGFGGVGMFGCCGGAAGARPVGPVEAEGTPDGIAPLPH